MNKRSTLSKIDKLLKKQQAEILELMKDVLESLGNRVDQAKERISDIEARNLEMTQVKGERMKSKKI